ncbi:T9SS type A sorting domain-containing protein [Polaribacter vadi]|uniref:LamG-like jellyroll fold domain-containing protein n=1 Tax=Polaribacter TaxID=52959 RepID=UPI001C089D2B|nr:MULTISPECIES: LamG-like jellyroll fold domain-containing protein [Polaribacter]MBU3011267.1 T9SS type A sorting domain-containing protein [Polaribacter vadi]MDO6741080.1 LamG-like jellyroll fold domain-containing protein [Polaribacter sp. 1_MG-2023]
MKKRLLILVGFLLCFNYAKAQVQESEHKLFTGTSAVDYKAPTSASPEENINIQMQIGGAMLHKTIQTNNNDVIGSASFGFPYGVLFIAPTFIRDKFEVSKGYYTNQVNITWQVGNNQDAIKSFDVYRRVLGSATDYELIAVLGSNTFEFNDTQVEGGVLFDYQIRANGVATNGGIGELYTNYVQGIGFRNPTATVSGGVTFEGGSPVKDVTVFAETIGAENSSATSLSFKNQETIAEIENISNIDSVKTTLQFWVNKNTDFFSLESSVLKFTSTTENLTNTNYSIEASVIANVTFNINFLKDGIPGSLLTLPSIPSGELNAEGDDILLKVSDLPENNFVHVSVILENNKEVRFFINGREINAAYITYMQSLAPELKNGFLGVFPQNGYVFQSENNEAITNLKFIGNNFKIDEFRAWNRVLSNDEIRRDYRRYLAGGENGLAIYLRMDEALGEFLYDLSKVGFTQNKNDAIIVGDFEFSSIRPSQSQLGVFGVTDRNGSYIISGIGYKGTGESFVITPSLGVHKFEPASQTLFLGTEESVVNQLNFKDVSSFVFRGRAVYNVQDVFNPIATTIPTNLRDFGYNKYLLGDVVINKGEYYYVGGSVNSQSGFYEGGVLQQYPIIPLEGAAVFIDGNPVFDADNQPVLSDDDGNFTISVPIGNHKVEVQKDGHTFELNGRFPETETFSFFEDQVETQYFIDDTRVTLVGRVVGGKNEFEKPIGFGTDGLFEVINNEGETNESIEILSSKNNIGTANITFKGDINSNALDKIIATNAETGEYKVELIPFQYHIVQNGISISSNPSLNILNSTETIDLRESTIQKTSEFTSEDNRVFTSEPYHFEKSFRYNSDVSLLLVSQEYETEFNIGGTTYNFSNLAIPFYKQKFNYEIVFEVIQKYINLDDVNNPIETKENFTEGAFNITNNLAAPRSDAENIRYVDSKYIYTFAAGIPNISKTDGFQKSINIQYIIEGNNPVTIENIENFKSQGIIKGGKSSDGKTFVTSAPETPDFILRDPPGSNSFASIERGTTISYEESRINSDIEGIGGGYFISVGPDVSFDAGIFSNTLEVVAETSGTFSKTVEELDEGVTRNTYTFNQTFSTSDSPEFVGSEGDLYVGNSKNIFYGLFDDMYITENIPRGKNGVEIPNIVITVLDLEDNEHNLYVSSYKNYLIAEQPTNTFFTYSQKFILETLIPRLNDLANNPNLADPDERRSPEFYTAQANSWKHIIQTNEKAKYDARVNRETVKEGILKVITDKFRDENNTETLNDLLDKEFYANRSFDAGLGEFTNSVSSVSIVTHNYQTVIDLEDEFQTAAGFFLNDQGASLNMTNTFNDIEDDTDTDVRETTTTISYTLKDNDSDNELSVDVVNLFDGNGPVFITRGGSTSCPHEDAEISNFYNLNIFGSDGFTLGNGGLPLSDGTNNVYDSEISVENKLISNVPEDESAIFKLLLNNNSQTQSDLQFIIEVDNTSLNGLSTNIAANGQNVFLPFNETIEFPLELKKISGSSDYEYENIRIYLYSPCATSAEQKENFIDVSVEFKKSCSNVNLSSPEENWIFNTNEAFSVDIDGNTTSNTLPVIFTDFNLDFNGFEKIELQYRSTSSSNWNKLASYYGSEALKNEAGDAEGIVINISDSDFTYNWDIVGNNIADGEYEIRAVSFCADDITNLSEIITGTINLNAPVVFGTPQPTDGILDVGEDVSLRFNEAVFERTTTSITVTGLQNQQEIDHNVSVFLDGSTNQIELPNQRLAKESFTLQFWYKNATTGSGLLVAQENGINVKVDGNHLEFSVGGELISTVDVNKPIDSSQYNFYSFVYQNGTFPQLLLFENGEILEERTLTQELDINTSSSMFIGGENVEGNIHDIRLWSKPFTPAQATLAKDITLTGREVNLLGYWKLDEGFGQTGLDKAKRKNAIVNLDWAIFPKGTGYEFKDNEYLTLDNVGFIQPSNFEDKTISFWIKPNETSAGTIFSNGKGDESEPLLTNGFRNKWSINLKTDGNLELVTENISYSLTTKSLSANNWTHIALVHKVGGSLNSYIDGEEQLSIPATKVGGFTGNKILIGARLFEDASNEKTIDNHFTGLLDEVRFWNTARSLEQINRDRYFEIDNNEEGLLLKLDFNEDDNNTTAGPAYNHLAANLVKGTTFAILSDGSLQSYSQDSPPLKPQLKFTNIPFSTVINGDEMIITPNLTDEEWSLFEGEIINFTVARLSDTHFNSQASPVTWSAFVNRQELEWFTKDQTKEIVAQKTVGETFSFTMDVINIGGSNQPFTISGLPIWMQAEVTSGSINPDSSKEITFTVDADLAMGTYDADLFLETASGFNDRLQFNLRVLTEAPDWSVNPVDYANSMNAIGRIQINQNFSRDSFTKVGAFINDEPRGEAYLTYDAAYDSYFAFLTVYENQNDNEVTFKIWDAINGKIINAFIDGKESETFETNKIIGSKSSPTIFSSTVITQQNLSLNKGWTWASFFVEDTSFNNLKNVFEGSILENQDIIKNIGQQAFYEDGDWFGDFNELTAEKMYKIRLENANNLELFGSELDITNFNINIFGIDETSINPAPKWNWLPYPIHRNISLQEALAFYEPTDGDVIKDQFTFAIYDATSGWSGTLNYLQSGRGYMLKSSQSQVFNYPDADVLSKTQTKITKNAAKVDVSQFTKYSSTMSIVAEVIADENFTKVLVYDDKNTLRGSSEIITLNDKKISFITAFSSSTENLRFVLANDLGELDVNKKFTFIDNEVLGDLKNPIQLSAKALSLNELIFDNTILYPNPFTKSIIIDFSNESITISKVEIYNTIGVKLLNKNVNNNQKIEVNTADLSIGVYLIKITDNSGKFVMKKIIKK